MQNTSRVSHPVRALAAASTATFVALFSHVIGGGAAPTLLGVLIPLLFSLLACSLLAGRTLSLLRISASVLASQALFHCAFVVSAFTAGAPIVEHAHHHGQGVHALLPALQGEAVMWAMHLIAAAITVLMLYRGEQAVHQLKRLSDHFAGWLRSKFAMPTAVPVAVPETRVCIETGHSLTALSRLHGSALTRRGPPLRIATAL